MFQTAKEGIELTKAFLMNLPGLLKPKQQLVPKHVRFHLPMQVGPDAGDVAAPLR